MEDLGDPKGLMEQKSKLKKEKITLLREVNKELAQLQAELDEAMPKDMATRSQNPTGLQEKIDKMEFYIATCAYTPAQEKEMVRSVQVIRNELKRALADDKTWGKVREIRTKIRTSRAQRKSLRKELDELSAQLDQLYKTIIETGTKQKKDLQQKRTNAKEYTHKKEEYRKQKEAHRKEIEPYMKEVDSFVSLEDIAIVDKRNKKKQ